MNKRICKFNAISTLFSHIFNESQVFCCWKYLKAMVNGTRKKVLVFCLSGKVKSKAFQVSNGLFYWDLLEEKEICSLFGPSMRAVLVGADIIKSHFLFSATCLCLEEDGLTMTTLWTGMIFGSWQCRIGNDVRNDVRQLTRKKIVKLWFKSSLIETHSISCMILFT